MTTTLHTRSERARLGRLPTVRFGAAYGTVMITAAVFTATHLAAHPAIVVLLAVTVAWSSRLTLGFAIALGIVSWAYFTGFVVNDYGALTFTSGDLVRLALFVALSGAAHWR